MSEPPLEPGPRGAPPPPVPRFAAPAPRDPRSIDVWPTFKAATGTWTRLAVPQSLLFALVFAPAFGLFALSAPNIAATVFGIEPVAIAPSEFYGLGGFVLLALTAGGLAMIAGFRQADAALDGRAVPAVGGAVSEGLGRVPAVFGAYLLGILAILVPYLLFAGGMIAVLVATGATREAGGSGFAFALIAIVVGLLVILPPMIYAGVVLRFGLVLAAVREVGPVGALRKGFGLMRGRFWRVFGYFVLIGIAVQALIMAGVTIGYILAPAQPVAASVLYGITLAACFPFQITQEMALTRRLEALRDGAAPAAAASAEDDEPAPEPVRDPLPRA